MAKRGLIQFLTAVIYNADVGAFFSGSVSRSPLKRVCVPGLNCYSCPAAVSSCPLGAVQGSLGGGRFPAFAAGFLALAGVLLGRAVCGFLCPFGFLQELLNKFGGMCKKRVPFFKRRAAGELCGSRNKNGSSSFVAAVEKRARFLKYAVLLVCVVFLPLVGFISSGAGSPFFCAWICPAGTLEAGVPLVLINSALRSAVGFLFAWKTVLAVGVVLWSLFVFRPFCKYICPLGALYSLFNKVAAFGVHVDAGKCTGCGKCAAHCEMNARSVNALECIRCGECVSVCAEGAIHIRGLGMHTNTGSGEVSNES